MEKDFNGSNLTLGNIHYTNDVYTRYYITYTSGALTISGIMNVPHGDGPFPVLVLNHGFIDPSIYTNGRGLKREQNFMARAGFIVLHPDYRNHADSSKDDRDALAVRLGYTEDVINAVYALKSSGLPFLDANNIGMLGHSMGGGITLNILVAQPGLIKAAVLYAPVSGNASYSYDRWLARESGNVTEISQLYGGPDESPEFWQNLSAETFYDRIVGPIKIFHGTSDDSVPLDWSYETEKKLKKSGVDVSLTVYEGEEHEFGPDWPNFMNSARDFFNDNLK
ncbi:alpha/beta fold hydrolase [Patescibacteria group bacterium]|nr:alpha/beta fold hydrolase [Patescibacteria group bacterium]